MYNQAGGFENSSGNQYNDFGDGQEASRSTGTTFQPNSAFADFMRNNDPNSNNANNSSRPAGTSASTRPNVGMNPSSVQGRQRQGPGGRRIMTSNTTNTMPSMRSVVPPNPAEPVLSSTTGSSRMSGVAMGTVFEGDSQSNASSRTPLVPSVGGQNTSGGSPMVAPLTSSTASENGPPPTNTRPEVSVGSSSVGFLPDAPYQEMLQSFEKEDPTIARARMQMASLKNSKQMERPYPKPGVPQEPTSQAMEPTIPQSRLGRRMMVHKSKREPSFVIPTIQSSANGMDEHQTGSNLECTGCRMTLRVPKTAIVILCPNCDQVQLVANCRVIRPPS